MNATPQSEIVGVRNVSKSFRTPEGYRIDALRNVSLSIRHNEFVTLLGPSGCGKTTLLRAIGGFEAPDSGEITIGGVAMGHAPPYSRPVNTMFQNYALFPHMTVEENVAYGLECKGVVKDERRKRVGEILELVHMEGMTGRKPHQLSGGQQQRVALARAIVNRPQILLLDEPLAALDRRLRQNMQVELKNLQNELKITFLCVTHDQEEALTMSDRLAVMKDGEILQVGAPNEIYERPGNRFIADFVGESNVFEARITSIDGGIARVDCGSGVGLSIRETGNAQPGDRVEILMRPEKFRVAARSAGSEVVGNGDAVVLQGRVVQSIYLGADVECTIQLENEKAVKARVRPGEIPAAKAFQIGELVNLSYSIDSPYVLSEAG